MLRRRLYLQIYLTIIASLVLMVILGGLLWDVLDGDRADRGILDKAESFAALVLPPADAPVAEQQDFITRLGGCLEQTVIIGILG